MVTSAGRRRLNSSGGAGRERRLDFPRRPDGAEDLDRRDCREREVRADILGNRGQPENVQIARLPRLAETLEVTTAEMPSTQFQRSTRNCVVHRICPEVE